jgi:hypothetical protein
MTTRSASDEPASDPKPAGQLPDIHSWRSLDEPNRYQVWNPHSGKLIQQTYSTSTHANHWGPQKSAATHQYVTVTKGRGWASGAVGGCTAGLGAKSDSRHRQASQEAQPGWARHGTTLVSGRRSGAKVGDRLQKNKRGASRWVRRAVASMSDKPVRPGRYDQRRFVPISDIMSS